MIDYKEVHKKDGSTLIFCNLEELAKYCYNVKSIEELDLVAETQGGEYICHCPWCKAEGHRKHKLYITKDFEVGHCFVCCRNFVNVTDKVDVSFTIPDFSKQLFGWQGFTPIKLTDPTWTLDRYKYEFDDYDEVGVKYLESRHQFMKDLYPILGFKFLDGNVVMPFKYKGEVFYYQIRFSGNSSIRYFFPPISAKPPYIIEHGNLQNPKLIICEGVYDAIACLIMAPDYIPVAVLGSSVSDYQIEFIREYVPSEIKIFMDEYKISKRIQDKLKTVIDYCPISIIYSDGPDPEERMKNLINTGQPLQWIK